MVVSLSEYLVYKFFLCVIGRLYFVVVSLSEYLLYKFLCVLMATRRGALFMF